MIRLVDLPIQRKLALSVALTCAATLLLACGAFVAYDVSSYRREMVANLRSLASIIAHNSTAALEFNDTQSATDTLASLRSERNIMAAFVDDRDGTVLATYQRDPAHALPRPIRVGDITHEFVDDSLRHFHPIMNKGEQIGALVIVSDLSEFRARMARYAVIVAFVFAVALLLAALLSEYFERLLIRPILKLAALTRTVAREKTYTGRATKEGNDEIGELIDGFNHMLTQLEARDLALQQAHGLLEKRVEERTAALRQAQADTFREQARFKLIFDAVPIGIGLIVQRPGGPKTRLFNDAHVRICGLTHEQAQIPGEFGRITHPDDYARQCELYGQVEAGTRPGFSLEKRYLTPDGRTVWVVYTVQRRYHADGSFEDLSTVVDITERKQAELERERTQSALRASEDKFSKAFRTHPDAITITRLRDNVVLDVNPGFTKLSGLGADEIVGRSARLDDLNLWAVPADRDRLVATLRSAGETSALETKFRHRDGSIVICSVTAGLMEIDGEPCMLAITRDLTAHKRLEAQLVHAGKMDAVGQLAGGVAHDYNNNLTATLLQLELLLGRKDLTPEIVFALQDLKKMADRAAGLTRQLLAFSRQQVIQFQTVELNDVVVQLLRMLSRLLGENIQVTFQSTADLLWIDADVGMLEQVATNLCINARDAMLPHGGRLTLGTSRVELPPDIATRNPEAQPGNFVCLSVEDTGCGMSAATLQHIFEPFFTTKAIGKGTGLGLATVYGIAKQHSGWVEVQSEIGRGSTFRVYFPAARHDPRPAPAIDLPPALMGNETILVVEDEELVRNMLTMALKKNGYRVLTAVDGPDAIRVWEKSGSEIALMLSDMVMPNGLTGLDLATRFKQARPKLKVIIASGYSVDLRKARLHANLGVAYLAKPFDVEKLYTLIRESLDGA